MNRILIVTSSNKSEEFFMDVLLVNHYEEIVTVTNCAQARRLLIEKDFDLCIINSPLIDEDGIGFARNVMTKGIGQVMLLVKMEKYDEVCSKVEDLGIFTLPKPINKAMFWNALKLCTASYYKMQIMQKQQKELLQKIEDIRIVDRAKCVLIECLKLTENEAHKHIEKQAMDMRLSKRAVAENILKTYEYKD